ncbi:HK97 family phage prohead protease [Sphingosinicella sp. BN140058]|uniref:HK97 family phage prohead protease n=1 Tax=Sphingosinicella sp. BN140058 TaxID=1892855 RepID=UPI00101091A5|nr:HK97 family phage prohead protease [Sphingosinicella sp. BN140058]QAY77915.1 HK97 family phage prohead protease [Sphingosinicella sp. BN140058]
MMLRKGFGFEVKDVSDEGVVEGYGSVFGGAPDSYGDIVRRGAFADTLAKHAAEGTMPLMLWGHQAGEVPIGQWDEMAEDRKGLFVKGRIDIEDPLGSRVHRALKARRTRGLSIGYETIASEPDAKREHVRHLTKLDLWEVSPVNFPAQRRAQVTGVKATIEAGQLPSLPEFEEFLREAGFTKTQATAIAGKGLSHLLRGEPGRDQAADFWSALRAQSGA